MCWTYQPNTFVLTTIAGLQSIQWIHSAGGVDIYDMFKGTVVLDLHFTVAGGIVTGLNPSYPSTVQVPDDDGNAVGHSINAVIPGVFGNLSWRTHTLVLVPRLVSCFPSVFCLCLWHVVCTAYWAGLPTT